MANTHGTIKVSAKGFSDFYRETNKRFMVFSASVEAAPIRFREPSKRDLDLAILKEAVSKKYAEGAAGVIRHWLGPKKTDGMGERKTLGFKGTAARHIIVAKEAAEDGSDVFVIREKPGVPWLKKIRTGWPETGLSTSSKGTWKRWVKHRNLHVAGKPWETNMSEKRKETVYAFLISRAVKDRGASSFYPEGFKKAEGRRFFNFYKYYQDKHAEESGKYIMDTIKSDKKVFDYVTEVMIAAASFALINKTKQIKEFNKRLNYREYVGAGVSKGQLMRVNRGWEPAMFTKTISSARNLVYDAVDAAVEKENSKARKE